MWTDLGWVEFLESLNVILYFLKMSKNLKTLNLRNWKQEHVTLLEFIKYLQSDACDRYVDVPEIRKGHLFQACRH